MKPYRIILGYQVYVERRRYGRTTYTWLYIDIDGERTQLGDPWPCITPKRTEIEDAIRYLEPVPHPSQQLSNFV